LAWLAATRLSSEGMALILFTAARVPAMFLLTDATVSPGCEGATGAVALGRKGAARLGLKPASLGVRWRRERLIICHAMWATETFTGSLAPLLSSFQ